MSQGCQHTKSECAWNRVEQGGNMMNTKTIIRWLTIAGMALGLSVPAVGAEKHTGDDSGQHEKEFSPVFTPNKKPEDRRLIRVSDEKPVAPTEEERLYRPPSRGAPGGRYSHSGG